MTEQKQGPQFDVVSLGETMLRLSVPIGERLDDARSFDVEIGGAESNVCVALSRLGRRCGWVSRLPDHGLGGGHLVSNKAVAAGAFEPITAAARACVAAAR